MVDGSQLAGALGLALLAVGSVAVWYAERQRDIDAAREEFRRLHAAHAVTPDSLVRDLLVVAVLPNPATIRVDAIAFCTADKRLYRRESNGWHPYTPRRSPPFPRQVLHLSVGSITTDRISAASLIVTSGQNIAIRNDNAASSEERTARRTHERNPDR